LKQADTDLRGIYEYIAFTLPEPGIAAGQLERIEKSIPIIRVMYGGRDIDAQLKK
jgi:plasmid stabilization system protein ParE